MRSREVFEPVAVGDGRHIFFDFSQDFPSPTEEVNTIEQVIAVVYSGEDDDVDLISESAIDDNPKRVRVSVTPAVAGVIYIIQCQIASTNGQFLIREGYLATLPGIPQAPTP